MGHPLHELEGVYCPYREREIAEAQFIERDVEDALDDALFRLYNADLTTRDCKDLLSLWAEKYCDEDFENPAVERIALKLHLGEKDALAILGRTDELRKLIADEYEEQALDIAGSRWSGDEEDII